MRNKLLLILLILILFVSDSVFTIRHGRALMNDEKEEEENDINDGGVNSFATSSARRRRRRIHRSKTETNGKKGGCSEYYSVGKWVYDESYPLYAQNCPYLSSAVSCPMNGRPDLDYQKWRWNPKSASSSCSLPRFNSLDFLGKMSKKRIMLVGDSIMRNQWESLVCLVQGVIPTDRKKLTYHGPTMAFHALDFGMSIEFHWAPMLVELKRDRWNKKVLHLDSIEANARHWRGVHVLVFSSAHWWTHTPNMNTWDYFMEGNKAFKQLNPMVAYHKGLTTWANWVDRNLDSTRARVIFRSMSPSHSGQSGWKCFKQSKPLPTASHPHEAEPNLVAKWVLRKMSFPVYFQDITALSALRRDGHPSVYRATTTTNHASSDCSHWCLPGVPDSWNLILNALL